MNFVNKFFTVLFLFTAIILPQNHRVLESNDKRIKIEFNFNYQSDLIDTTIDGRIFTYFKSKNDAIRNPGEPWLPDYVLQLGVPHSSSPSVKVLDVKQSTVKNKFILPCPISDPSQEKYDPYALDENIYSSNKLFPLNVAKFYDDYEFRYSRIIPLSVSPVQYNPVTRDITFNNKIVIEVDYNASSIPTSSPINDPMTKDLLQDVVINFNQAEKWIGKDLEPTAKPLGEYWYDSNKNYFKIYVKTKGVYRITFEELVNAGVPITGGVESDKIAIYNNGEPVPIDIVDRGDGLFNSGDYLQFVGFPAKASDFSYFNLYNNSNVYWFTYENTEQEGRYYRSNGFPTSYQRTFQSVPEVVHFEKDSIYERLGYAPNGDRDHWFWGKATAQNGQSTGGFEYFFPIFDHFNTDSNYVKIRVNLHGMLNNSFCYLDNKAHIELTGQPLGSIHWEGQNAVTFEKRFYASQDSIRIFPEGNAVRVWNYGDACANVNSGDVRINWIEFEYWKYLRADQNKIFFTSPNSTPGIYRYWMTLYERDTMIVYIPQKNKIIDNVQFLNDQINTVLFTDSVLTPTRVEYFCVSDDYYNSVDSIKADLGSDLRNVSNGADYLIITHENFESVANRLKSFREINFPDTSIPNPKIMIADVHQIYDEFSYGLQDPYAIKNFIQYAFENWQTTTPSYVVLLGDMSYDYRHLITTSRPNFIPSIPFFSYTYGEAASDNQFVAVSGTDVVPDLAIGRLSIETVEEGNILLDKIESYPEDPGKAWKQNTLLIASGLSLEDENNFGFNDASLLLDNTYIQPEGYGSSKVFRYPSKPEHFPYQGEGPQIREEFNKGAVLANYYGHGGGYQWDLVFTNDDIYLLENGGRLPYIISVTCYTAHFDNQNVFGEQFNKVPGKGSIGFFGSSGLTYWQIGKAINQQFFNEVYKKRNFIVGKAILKAKSSVPSSGVYATQIALLTNLGDPVLKLALPDKPDFVVKSSDIKIQPNNPLVGDTVTVKVNIQNLGPVFTPDSVVVELFVNSVDTTYRADSTKIGSFAEMDSVLFTWIPNKGNLYELSAKVNLINSIPEMDYSDNSASEFFVVYNISQPNIVDPIDGFSTNNSKVDFLFADIGHYIDRQLAYYIEIDTSLAFAQPVIVSAGLSAENGILKWETTDLNQGVYFWRSRIFDGENYGNWSETRSFIITSDPKTGYLAHESSLKQFTTYNMNYSESDKSLILNTSILPPKPYVNTLIDDLDISPALPDSIKLNTITTDGTFLYASTVWFFAAGYNSNGFSRIYKFGTGLNGTVAGEFLGTFSDFYGKVYNSIFYHSDGNLYVYSGKSNWLYKINVQTEVIDSVNLPTGILNWEGGRAEDGPAYLNSDGNYVYNLTLYDSLGVRKYVLRIFNPSNNWEVVEPYKVLSGSSYEGFSGFFVAHGYIYPGEYLYSNFMRRINLSNGIFEEEWSVYQPFQSYYSWCFDWVNNYVYSGVFRPFGYTPKFSKFIGEYTDASGYALSKQVGPVLEWESLSFDIVNPGTTGRFKADLQGFNNNTKIWDTLQTNIPPSLDIGTISSNLYRFLRVNFNFVDSSFGGTIPMKLRSVNFNYKELPEIVLSKNNIDVNPDTVLQGLTTNFSLKTLNVGNNTAQNLGLSFYLNDEDSAFQKLNTNVLADSSIQNDYIIDSSPLLFDNKIKVLAQLSGPEYFTFNNKIENSFYVSRDSVNPKFQITFDGREIIDNDIISSEPKVKITLEDNSPLPLTPNMFTIVHNGNLLNFNNPADSLKFEYQPYPNSRADVFWNPSIKTNGRQVLEVLAKDSSGNFFDSTSSRTVFYVYNENDVRDVYNYPNPFTDYTFFTFELRGQTPPEEMKFKIFTVAGRLIYERTIPQSELRIGFNKLEWNGRDQDGDEIANGVYFYKVITKFGDETKTVTQKMAKVK